MEEWGAGAHCVDERPRAAHVNGKVGTDDHLKGRRREKVADLELERLIESEELHEVGSVTENDPQPATTGSASLATRVSQPCLRHSKAHTQ